MALVVQPDSKCHALVIRADGKDLTTTRGAPELIVVGRGTRTYLWVGDPDGEVVLTFGGAGPLRELARAILKAVGEG